MADVINLAFQISADLKGVQSQLRTLEGNFSQSLGKINAMAAGIGRVFGGLGLGLGVGSVVAFGKSVVDVAGQLQDLEDQTGISAQLLSGMKSLFEETGTSAEAFAKGIFTAQRNLGQINSETDQAAIAVKQLGLNLNQLRNASPQKFLELIADALSKIDNPVQKAALGAQLLGRQFRELAPALSQAAGRLEEFRKQGMNAEDIKRLDAFGDSWVRLTNQLQILASGPLASVLEGFERLFNLTDRAKLVNSLVAVSDEIERIDAMLKRREELRAKGLGFFTGGKDEEAIAQREALLERQREIDKQLNKLNAGGGKAGQSPFVAAPDLAAQKKAVDAQKKAAEELKKIMEEAAKATADAIDQTQKEWEDAGKGMIDVFKGLRVEALDPVARELAAINERFNEWKNTLVDAGNVTGQSMEPFIKQLEVIREKALLAADPLVKLKKEWEAMRALELERMHDQDAAERIDLDPSLGKVKKEGFGDIESLIRGGAQGISDSLRSVALGTQTLGEAWSNMGLAAVAAIQNTIVELLILKPLIEGLKTSFEDSEDTGGIFGFIGGLIGKLFGGSFAEGGVVPGPIGAPRLAKVHGGETIFPPNKMAMGGGGTVNNYIDARGAERGVSQEIQRAIEMSREKAVRQSVSAVGEERARSNAYARRFGR